MCCQKVNFQSWYLGMCRIRILRICESEAITPFHSKRSRKRGSNVPIHNVSNRVTVIQDLLHPSLGFKMIGSPTDASCQFAHPLQFIGRFAALTVSGYLAWLISHAHLFTIIDFGFELLSSTCWLGSFSTFIRLLGCSLFMRNRGEFNAWITPTCTTQTQPTVWSFFTFICLNCH